MSYSGFKIIFPSYLREENGRRHYFNKDECCVMIENICFKYIQSGRGYSVFDGGSTEDIIKIGLIMDKSSSILDISDFFQDMKNIGAIRFEKI